MRPLINSLSCQTFGRKVSWEWRLFDACILVLYTFKNDSEPFHLNAAGGWFCYRVRFKTNALALLGVSTAFISTKFAWRLDASPRIFASFRCANFRTDSGGYKLQSLLWLADPAGDWSHEKRLHRTVLMALQVEKDLTQTFTGWRMDLSGFREAESCNLENPHFRCSKLWHPMRPPKLCALWPSSESKF